jgi:hypothetical protein
VVVLRFRGAEHPQESPRSVHRLQPDRHTGGFREHPSTWSPYEDVHRRWQSITRGVWFPPGKARNLDECLRAWALVLPPTAAFTHLTAAAAYGWWLPEAPEHPFFAAMPAWEPRPRRPGLLVFRHPHPPDCHDVRGLRLTTPAETLIALARDLAPLDLVVLADSAVRQGDVTVEELTRVATGTKRRGAPALRALVPLIDERSESAWESVMRLLHHAADIPVEPQRALLDHAGRFVARADLWVCGTRRVHEYDGGGHRDPAVHEADLTRDRAMSLARWERHGFTKRHLLQDAAAIIRATDELLGRPGDPARLQAWQGALNASMLRRPGRVRVQRRWGLA